MYYPGTDPVFLKLNMFKWFFQQCNKKRVYIRKTLRKLVKNNIVNVSLHKRKNLVHFSMKIELEFNKTNYIFKKDKFRVKQNENQSL